MTQWQTLGEVCHFRRVRLHQRRVGVTARPASTRPSPTSHSATTSASSPTTPRSVASTLSPFQRRAPVRPARAARTGTKEPQKPSELPVPFVRMVRPRRSFGRHRHPQPRLRPRHRAYPRIHSQCRGRTNRVAGTAIRPRAARIAAPGSKHAQAAAQRDEAVQIPRRATARVRGARPDYPGPRYPNPSRRAHAAIPRRGTSPGNRVRPRCTNTSAMMRSATLYNVVE